MAPALLKTIRDEGRMAMRLTYADIEMAIAQGGWIDRSPKSPLFGFIVGFGVSLMLWGAIGFSAWALLA
jgi:hypothetical protein